MLSRQYKPLVKIVIEFFNECIDSLKNIDLFNLFLGYIMTLTNIEIVRSWKPSVDGLKVYKNKKYKRVQPRYHGNFQKNRII